MNRVNGVTLFTGTIPSSIGLLTQLTLLDLDSNCLTGMLHVPRTDVHIHKRFSWCTILQGLSEPYLRIYGHIFIRMYRNTAV